MSVCILLVVSIVFGHTATNTESVSITAFDFWENICWEFEKARLDNFAIQLQHENAHLGYIVVYAGKESCADEAVTRALRAKKWLEKRGVPAARIPWRTGGFREHTETYLWIWPADEGVFPVDPRLSESEVKIVRSCKGAILKPMRCK